MFIPSKFSLWPKGTVDWTHLNVPLSFLCYFSAKVDLDNRIDFVGMRLKWRCERFASFEF